MKLPFFKNRDVHDAETIQTGMLRSYGISRKEVKSLISEKEVNIDDYIDRKDLLPHSKDITTYIEGLSSRGRKAANEKMPPPIKGDLTSDEETLKSKISAAAIKANLVYDNGLQKLARIIGRSHDSVNHEKVKAGILLFLQRASAEYRDNLTSELTAKETEAAKLSIAVNEIEDKIYAQNPPTNKSFFEKSWGYVAILGFVATIEAPVNYPALQSLGIGNGIIIILLTGGISLLMAYTAHLIGSGIQSGNKVKKIIGGVLAGILFTIIGYLRFIPRESVNHEALDLITGNNNDLLQTVFGADLMMLLIGITAFIIGCYTAYEREKNAAYWREKTPLDKTNDYIIELENDKTRYEEDLEYWANEISVIKVEENQTTLDKQLDLLKEAELAKSNYLEFLEQQWNKGTREFRNGYRNQTIYNKDTPDDFWSSSPPPCKFDKTNVKFNPIWNSTQSPRRPIGFSRNNESEDDQK